MCRRQHGWGTTVAVAEFNNPRELRLLTADYHLGGGQQI